METLNEVCVGLGEVTGEVGAGATVPLTDLKEIVRSLGKKSSIEQSIFSGFQK